MASQGDARPTLKTLAEITGLGISTVSQALRDSPAIAEETRRRVQLAAQQAGYRPNRAGVRLRTGRSNVITVILNAQDAGSGFFADFVYGVSSGLAGTAYHLVITPYDYHDQMAPVRYVVETASADGVIISRIMPNDPRVRYMAENGMPFATHGRTEMGICHPYHDYDNEPSPMRRCVSSPRGDESALHWLLRRRTLPISITHMQASRGRSAISTSSSFRLRPIQPIRRLLRSKPRAKRWRAIRTGPMAL